MKKSTRILIEQELERKAAALLKEACLQRDRDDALVKTVEALAAVAWHAQTAAEFSWSQPLPVRTAFCESLLDNEHNALRLLGHFGNSLRWSKFDIARHPPFEIFCRGVLAAGACSNAMLRDRELRQMFPLEPCVGITGPSPQWRATA